jgi:precorrin-4 methylase
MFEQMYYPSFQEEVPQNSGIPLTAVIAIIFTAIALGIFVYKMKNGDVSIFGSTTVPSLNSTPKGKSF